jgi:uncharacterized protein with FMN-binding domain
VTFAVRASTAVLGALAALSLSGCQFAEKIDKLTIDDIRPASVKDGEYTGTMNIVPVTASVRVTVKGGRIEAIRMLSHTHGPKHGADAILDRVIAAQSLAVDAVTGSSYSSKVVLEAIELALKKGQ